MDISREMGGGDAGRGVGVALMDFCNKPKTLVISLYIFSNTSSYTIYSTHYSAFRLQIKYIMCTIYYVQQGIYIFSKKIIFSPPLRYFKIIFFLVLLYKLGENIYIYFHP